MYKKSFLWWRKNRPEVPVGHQQQKLIFVVTFSTDETEYTADYFEIAKNDDLVFWCYPYVSAVLRKAEWDKVRYLKIDGP